AAAVRALGQPAARRELESAEGWQWLADLEADLEPCVTLTSAHRSPAAIQPLLAAEDIGVGFFDALAGRLHLRVPQELAPERASALLELGCVPVGAPAAPGWIAREQAVLALRQRIRRALDPMGLLALGDRWERGAD